MEIQQSVSPLGMQHKFLSQKGLKANHYTENTVLATVCSLGPHWPLPQEENAEALTSELRVTVFVCLVSSIGLLTVNFLYWT